MLCSTRLVCGCGTAACATNRQANPLLRDDFARWERDELRPRHSRQPGLLSDSGLLPGGLRRRLGREEQGMLVRLTMLVSPVVHEGSCALSRGPPG